MSKLSLLNFCTPLYRPCREKTSFLHNREADQRLCFHYTDSTILLLLLLNPKFQASSHLLWLYSPVCVGHGRKPRRPVFSQRGSYQYKCHSLIFNCLSILINPYNPMKTRYRRLYGVQVWQREFGRKLCSSERILRRS